MGCQKGCERGYMVFDLVVSPFFITFVPENYKPICMEGKI